MKLKTLLENSKGINIKVGAKANFFYCGENNEDANKFLRQYLERDVIYCVNGISNDEPNTKVVKIEGNETGRFWTIKEFQSKKTKLLAKMG